MKRVIMVAISLMFFGNAFSQDTNTNLNLRYNTTLARYELWAKPTSSLNFNLGPSQISLVFPASMADAPLTVTSVSGGTWTDNSRIYAPTVTPSLDYHAFASIGAPVTWVGNTETLIFHFTLPGGCVAGLRVFDNNTDPDSNGAGMQGGDFFNTFNDAAFTDHYNGVYNNTGTTCSTPPVCNVNAPTISLN